MNNDFNNEQKQMNHHNHSTGCPITTPHRVFKRALADIVRVRCLKYIFFGTVGGFAPKPRIGFAGRQVEIFQRTLIVRYLIFTVIKNQINCALKICVQCPKARCGLVRRIRFLAKATICEVKQIVVSFVST